MSGSTPLSASYVLASAVFATAAETFSPPANCGARKNDSFGSFRTMKRRTVGYARATRAA